MTTATDSTLTPPAEVPDKGVGCGELVRPVEIGDLVEPTPESRFVLRCGCGSYADAVCVSVSPLVLVSWDADMRWSATVKPEYFRSKGRVAASVMRRCNKRLLA